MSKKFNRFWAALLAIVLIFISPIESIAYLIKNARNTGSTTENMEVGSKWSVPTTLCTGIWGNLGSDSPVLASSSGNQRIQIKDYSLVTVNEDGTYRIRLEYASYGIYDIIQIVDPEKVDDLKAYMNDGATALTNAPIGDFNAPTAYFNDTNAAKHIAAGNITENANQYYWHQGEVSISQADADLDTGYIIFDTEDLSGEWIIRAYFSRGSNFTTACSTLILRLNQDGKYNLPKSLTINEETTNTGFSWTNYANISTMADGLRNADTTALDLLTSLFEDTVAVKKNEKGELTAVFSWKDEVETNLITSVQLADSRNSDYAESSYGAYLRQEFVDIEWRELFSSDQIEIRFKDLMDGKLFKVSTQSKDSTNAGKTEQNKSYYYGTLWLTGYKEDVEEASVTSYLSVPITLHTAQWNNIGNPDAAILNSSNIRMQVKDNALVKVLSDGTYQVRLEYASYSIYDMIQIVDINKLAEFTSFTSLSLTNSPVMK